MPHIVTINRRALLIGIAAVLHVAVPWLTSVLFLVCLTSFMGDLHAPGFQAALVVVGVTCLFLVELPKSLSVQATWAHLPAATGIIAHWLGIQVVLLAIMAVSDVLDPIGFDVYLVWSIVTPLLVVAAEIGVRKAMSSLLKRTVRPRRAVMAGYSKPSAVLARRLATNGDLFMHFLGFFDDRSSDRLGIGENERLLGNLLELPAYVRDHDIDVIFVALPIRHVKRVMDLLEALHDSTVSIYYVPDIFVFDLIQARATEIDGVPVVAMRETPFHGYRVIVKRVTDIVLSFAMLCVFAPVLLVAAICIKATSPGPIIFKQRRYGLDGEEIFVYKLRTMTVMDTDGPVVQAGKNDPRVTPIGRILRRTSMDELPQLFNVLEGTMSLVGPRPHAVAHNEQYRRLIKGYMVRHKALPGITGLAQVSGCRGETARLEEMERRVTYDLDYLRNWSVMLDIRILLLTIVKVWRDDKAY